LNAKIKVQHEQREIILRFTYRCCIKYFNFWNWYYSKCKFKVKIQ